MLQWETSDSFPDLNSQRLECLISKIKINFQELGTHYDNTNRRILTMKKSLFTNVRSKLHLQHQVFNASASSELPKARGSTN